MSARYLNSALIAVSQAVRDDYRRHLGLDDVEVIYNYIDTAAFPPVSPEASLAQRRALGWKADDFVIVQIARLAWDKGQEILVRALPGIVRSVPNVRALFVGEGPILPGLLDLARTLGVQDRLEFIGRQTATHPYLGMANVFVFPSVVEGLGIALLEAMAMGLPIVASRTGGILEVATDGSDALLVPPGDAGALADAIVRLHADPSLARRLGSRAQQTVEARFSARQGVSRLDALYTRLAAA
jgi:glycosyltransferase involved in cell wall biosynthesis